MEGNSEWGLNRPPHEAYGPVTNAERFGPLHDVAFRLLDQLEATFAVERLEGYGLDPELENVNLVHPTVKLLPQDPQAAPMVVVFTAFPGLRIRVGFLCKDAFPSCGCDACNETADGETTRLSELVEAVTAGRFHETINIPLLGSARQEWEYWSSQGRSTGGTRVDRSHARQILDRSKHLSIEWKPWAKRSQGERFNG